MFASYNEPVTPVRPAVSRRLLLIEPDATTRSAMAYILEMAGYLVAQASHGPEALASLPSVEPPELILLNVKQAWAFRQGQKHLPDLAAVPVVVYAPTDCPEARDYSLDAVAYLEPPFGHKHLLGVVGRYCPLTGGPA